MRSTSNSKEKRNTCTTSELDLYPTAKLLDVCALSDTINVVCVLSIFIALDY